MIYKVDAIESLKEIWKSLIDSDSDPIYLTYEIHKLFAREFRYGKLFSLNFAKKLVYICRKDNNGITDLIAPLIIDKRNKIIVFDGVDCAAGYNDFIYKRNGTDLKSITELMDYLKTTYPGYYLKLVDLKEGSLLDKIVDVNPYKQCYKIGPIYSYEDWFVSLSTNTRGTVRLAYNRIKSDGKELQFCFEESMSFKTVVRVYRIYMKRLRENLLIQHKLRVNAPLKIKRALGFLPRLISSSMFWGFNQIKRSRIAYTKIDGRIVAFHLCYVDEGGLIFPKCGFDSDYKRYSPGIINIAEIIRMNTVDGEPFIMDTSRGYHEYKVRYGGKEYLNYSIEMNL